jgi:hypothetical protein
MIYIPKTSNNKSLQYPKTKESFNYKKLKKKDRISINQFTKEFEKCLPYIKNIKQVCTAIQG